MTDLKLAMEIREFHSMFPSVAGTLRTRLGYELSRTGRVKACAKIQSVTRDRLELLTLRLVERAVTDEWLIDQILTYLAAVENLANVARNNFHQLADDAHRFIDFVQERFLNSNKIKLDWKKLPRISTPWLFSVASDNTNNLDFYRGRIIRALKHRVSAE